MAEDLKETTTTLETDTEAAISFPAELAERAQSMIDLLKRMMDKRVRLSKLSYTDQLLEGFNRAYFELEQACRSLTRCSFLESYASANDIDLPEIESISLSSLKTDRFAMLDYDLPIGENCIESAFELLREFADPQIQTYLDVELSSPDESGFVRAYARRTIGDIELDAEFVFIGSSDKESNPIDSSTRLVLMGEDPENDGVAVLRRTVEDQTQTVLMDLDQLFEQGYSQVSSDQECVFIDGEWILYEKGNLVLPKNDPDQYLDELGGPGTLCLFDQDGQNFWYNGKDRKGRAVCDRDGEYFLLTVDELFQVDISILNKGILLFLAMGNGFDLDVRNTPVALQCFLNL